MNFDKFEAGFVKENKKLKLTLAITIMISLIAIIMQIFERRYFLYQGGAIFEERLMSEEICRLAFVGLANGSPNPHVVTSELIKIAHEQSFNIAIDKLLLVKSIEEGFCQIVLKSEGSITGFKLRLQASDNYPFHYKLVQLDEIALNGEAI
jgi:hypothetical protein